ncbi:MAG: undecaprenyl-diphosphate phosphatase [Actinomycetota bacterium]
MSYFQAIVMGILQGVTELFPVSSLGHGVLVPALFGWHNLVGSENQSESFFLAFLVGLHVGTAVALIVYYRKTWVELGGGLFTSIKRREVTSSNQRLAWLLICATIPVGIVGLAFEHKLRVLFASPKYAAIFLTLNGFVMLAGELLRRRSVARHSPHLAIGDAEAEAQAEPRYRLETLPLGQGVMVGAAQIFALLAGISRSGITMVAGLIRGLDHEDAARFSFLLATPVILAAGIYKLPDMLGSNGNGVRGQILVGSICAGLAAYASIRFLVRYFATKTLWPFAIYCLVAGGLCIIKFA